MLGFAQERWTLTEQVGEDLIVTLYESNQSVLIKRPDSIELLSFNVSNDRFEVK